jgi:hypothetical protein
MRDLTWIPQGGAVVGDPLHRTKSCLFIRVEAKDAIAFLLSSVQSLVAPSHDFRGILCAILCLGNESRAQRIAGCMRERTQIIGFSDGAEDSAALHAHETNAYDPNCHRF